MFRIPVKEAITIIMQSCPLCSCSQTRHYFTDKRRSFFQCDDCSLVFAGREHWLDAKSEKAHYDLHENQPYDPGYRRFLSRVAEPLSERLQPEMHGIDFGCGPGPTLALMLQEKGFTMALYDVYFHPDDKVLEHQYDFMTATEVIEHLYHPQQVWQQWLNLVKPGGWIGIMTKLVIDVEAFTGWHYKNDPTHVVFFSRATFQYLAERDKLELEFIGNDVILLRKSSNES